MDPFTFPQPEAEDPEQSDADSHIWLQAAAALSPHDPLLPPLSPPPSLYRRSAFAAYRIPPEPPSSSYAASSSGVPSAINVHRRLIEFLRRTTTQEQQPVQGVNVGVGDGRGSSGFRQMMRERVRREKLSQGYADLHAFLPAGTKATKNAILQAAVKHFSGLGSSMDGLRRRNEELNSRMIAAAEADAMIAMKSSEPAATEAVSTAEEATTAVKFEVRARDPPSAIEAAITAVRVLRGMAAPAKKVSELRYSFYEQEMCATLVAAADIEPEDIHEQEASHGH